MTIRWYGANHDSVQLRHIRQVPGVSGVAGTLMDKAAGELWALDEILALKKEVETQGLELEVIESVNIHDDIKLGLPSREEYIQNYIHTIENLGTAGIKVICYNFMPVFDWLRTDLHRKLDDLSETMCYEDAALRGMNDPGEIIDAIVNGAEGFMMPGWEPERLAEIRILFQKYEGITTQRLYENLGYFLDKIIPTCEEYGVRMAMHPDDPPWEIMGLPRVYNSADAARAILGLNNSPYHGLTICTGSLGVSDDNDVPAIIREFGQRIYFAHVRNFKKLGKRDFYESSHLTTDGTLDMYEVMKALYESAPNCYTRPDHGRMIWDEKARPGYGLYDRALGATYLNGLWEAIGKR